MFSFISKKKKMEDSKETLSTRQNHNAAYKLMMRGDRATTSMRREIPLKCGGNERGNNRNSWVPENDSSKRGTLWQICGGGDSGKIAGNNPSSSDPRDRDKSSIVPTEKSNRMRSLTGTGPLPNETTKFCGKGSTDAQR